MALQIRDSNGRVMDIALLVNKLCSLQLRAKWLRSTGGLNLLKALYVRR